MQSFTRETDLDSYSDTQLLDACKAMNEKLLAGSEHILNGVISLGSIEVSKLFVSVNRELDQNYAWINGNLIVVYRENDKVVQAHEGAYGTHMAQESADRVADVFLVVQQALADFPACDAPGDVLKGVAQQLPFMFFPEFYLIIKPAHASRLLSYSLLTRAA